MYIGIDEVGTFGSKEQGCNLFVASHFYSKELLQNTTIDFERWKKRNKAKKNHNGEIKGSKLTYDELKDFVNSVITRNPFLYFSIIGTYPSAHSEDDIREHHEYQLKGLEKGIKECKNSGNDRLATQYEEMRRWYSKQSPQKLLKILLLPEIIGESINSHIIMSVLDKKDETLGELSVLIDEDHIRELQPTIYWKDLLRSFLYQYFHVNPMPIIEEWDENHPFVLAKGAKKEPICVDNDHVLRSAINFAKSHEHTEIQVSDIVATICDRYQNKGECEDLFEVIKCRMKPPYKNQIKLVQLAPKGYPKSQIENPYKKYKHLFTDNKGFK